MNSWLQRIRIASRERVDLAKRLAPPVIALAAVWGLGQCVSDTVTSLAEHDLDGDGKREAIVVYRGMLGYIDGNLNEQLRIKPEVQLTVCSGKNPEYNLPFWQVHSIGFKRASSDCNNQNWWGHNFFSVRNFNGLTPSTADKELYLFYGVPSTYEKYPELGRSYRVK